MVEVVKKTALPLNVEPRIRLERLHSPAGATRASRLSIGRRQGTQTNDRRGSPNRISSGKRFEFIEDRNNRKRG